MILIIDFGSQTTQLIARQVRAAQTYCEVVPWPHAEAALARLTPKAIILSDLAEGSDRSTDLPTLPPAVLAAGVPLLGIGHGQQMLIEALGGRVQIMAEARAEDSDVQITGNSPLFDGICAVGEQQRVWLRQLGGVQQLPAGARVVAISGDQSCAAFADDARRIHGIAFHPEMDHGPDGERLIRNFLRLVADVQPTWTMAQFRDRKIAEIREQVGSGQVICGLSGGVDSAVTAALVHAAIGDQLTCVLVDNGLLRLNEAADVVRLFRDEFHIKLVHVDAEKRFLAGLQGVTDPEAKRKFIGQTFIEVFEDEARQIGEVGFLAQGTVYPDIIESVAAASGGVAVKSHHNVGGLPERMNMALVEPLRELFKDEVRELGRLLGLPDVFVGRHPFPGPGLAVRIPGEVTKEACDTLRLADAIYMQEIRDAGLYDEIWQAFALLLPVRTVGAVHGRRSYDRVCALRAINSVDGMTAQVYPFSAEFLGRVAVRIVEEVPGINRVVYDYTPKPPGTVEWE